MRGKRAALLALALVLALTGCSAAMEKRALKKSGIYEKEEYLNYQAALEAGTVVPEGEYRGYSSDAAEFLKEADKPAGEPEGVKVTLAENSRLTVSLYADEEKTKPVAGDGTVLPSGTALYAAVTVRGEQSGDKYVFDGFRIRAVKGDGTVEVTEQRAASDGLVCVVPSDGTRALSILPLGRYEDRVLTLSAQRFTSSGKKEAMSGQWLVNGERVDTARVMIGSAAGYEVKFDYSTVAESYYPDRASASPEIAEDAGGVAVFRRQEPKGGAESFSLVFRPYIKLTLSTKDYIWLLRDGIVKSVTVNGEELKKVDRKTVELGDRFKIGDRIVIRVKKAYSVTAEALQVTGPVETDNGRTAEYTVTVPAWYYGADTKIEVVKSGKK